jgi:hypothetical protein
MIELLEDLALVEDRADTSLGEDACLGHLLHCKQLLVLLALDLPDFPEATLTNRIVILEIRLSYRLLCHLYIGKGEIWLPVKCSVSSVTVASWKLQLPIIMNYYYEYLFK